MFLRALLFIVCCIFSGVSAPQKSLAADKNSRIKSFHAIPNGKRSAPADSDSCVKHPETDTDPAIRQLVRNILGNSGLPKPIFQTMISNSAIKTRFATATTQCDEPIIVFSQEFLERLKKGTENNWSLYSVAAHEIGHHLGYHINGRKLEQKDMELEADYFSGYTLARLGATQAESIGALDLSPSDEQIKHYPSISERKSEVGRGWRSFNTNSLSFLTWLNDKEKLGVDAVEFDNMDINGFDINPVEIIGLTLKGCVEKCRKQEECSGISFDKWNGSCFMKKKSLEKAQLFIDAKSILVLKKVTTEPVSASIEKYPLEFTYLNDYRIFGEQLEYDGNPGNKKECRSLCKGVKKCLAYTYSERENECSLFSTAIGRKFDPNSDSGYMAQEASKK